MSAKSGSESCGDATSRPPEGLTLYSKPTADGTANGDCPFAHYIRIVLHEKDLAYDLRPTAKESKPVWLVDDYGGKMPALCHERRCVVESDAIARYVDCAFPEPSLAAADEGATAAAAAAVRGFFPAFARFAKHRPNGDGDDDALRTNLEGGLQRLEDHLSDGGGRAGPYLAGDGTKFTLIDCSMAPMLYHMDVCLESLKGSPIDITGKYPAVQKYMYTMFSRQSFKDTVEYGPETVVWGWTSH